MSASMLTAQQVQDLLDVDASTIYRMASDGRLPAVRIGRQWRFPADAIEALLVPGGAVTEPTVSNGQARTIEPTPELPGDLITAALEALAPALGVSMVVTDLAGRPIVPIVNPAPAIAARMHEAGFAAECALEWRAFADEAHLAPRLQQGRFGFQCAHSLVRHDTTLIAMVLAGGIAPAGSDDPDLFHLDDERRAAVLDALPRTAALLSHLARERSSVPTT